MEVREEQICQRERDAVAHHLALRSFAAVEEQRLTFAHERDRCDIALHGGTRRGRAEQASSVRPDAMRVIARDASDCVGITMRIHESPAVTNTWVRSLHTMAHGAALGR